MSAALDTYCVMGDPIAHSRSPWIHARFAELTGERLSYEARRVPLADFADALRRFALEGGRGCNITVPLKREAARLSHTRSERVAQAGAANTLVLQGGRIHADNTDGLGLVADIEQGAGVPLAGRDVLLIGAGGAAAGVLGPLLARAPRRIAVCNRTAARAEELVARHLGSAKLSKTELLALDQQALDADFDLIINATSSSLSGGPVPVPARVLRPGALAYDMMYGPPAQGFLDWAGAHGAVSRDGLGMLVEQAAQSFLLWRGVRPPSTQVLSELRALLAA
ncbi:MAG: shikimate dehydrogenase [Comamonas sp.]|nr:shikimate dehydrogenase [Comamonas sp.]